MIEETEELVQIHIPQNDHTKDLNEIKITKGPKKKDSNSSDRIRTYLPWESREEQYLENLSTLCKTISITHNKKSKRCKLHYNLLSVPAILLPIVVASIHEYVPNELITTLIIMTVGLLNALNAFLNMGKKQTQHNQFGTKYNKLAIYINSQLIRPRKNRVTCDVFLERVDLRFEALNATAPDI